MLFGVTYCNLMKYKHGTCVATVLSGLLFNSFTQLSKTVIVVMATAPLLLGVVALFYGRKSMKWSSMLKVSAITLSVISAFNVRAELGEPEIEDLKFGFIKLTDMAPLAVAYEKGFLKMRAYTSL